MNLDLTDDETRALVAHLKHALEYDPFPFAPRLDPAESDPRQAGASEGSVGAVAPLRPGAEPNTRSPEMKLEPALGGVVLAAVLFGCTPDMQYSSSTQYAGSEAYLPLPAPLEGETVANGHLCDPRAMTQAVTHKYPDNDPAIVQQEVQNFLYKFGCGISSEAAPALAEPSPALVATPTLPSTSSEEIKIERRGNSYVVPVRINETITLPFILDTGAEELIIPADVALTLMRAGALTQSDFIGKGRYVMANGSEESQERVVIREVQVGNNTARDVTASVSSVAGTPLLGESFLSKFGKVTIDNYRLILILSP